MRTDTSIRRRVALAGVFGFVLVSGCARDAERLELSSADFAAEGAPIVVTSSRPAVQTPQAGSGVAVAGVTGAAPTGPAVPLEPSPFTVRAGGPEDAGALVREPTAAGDEILVDAKVGDINGRAIFVDAFLDPLSGRLLAESERMSPPDWARFAQRLIWVNLDAIVKDELLRAEALSRYSPEQKQGLRASLGRIRDQLRSANYGSDTLAESTLLEERGLTPTEHTARQEATFLVGQTIQREIRNRVQVSWRDVKQRYERDIDRYQPPPTAVFRFIRVREGDAPAVAESLATGTPFEEVAAGDSNRFESGEDGAVSLPFGDDGEITSPYASAELNELIASLRPGEWGGPVQVGSSRFWAMLERIEDRSTDLYDVQREIWDEIYQARAGEYRERYYAELTEGAIEAAMQRTAFQLFIEASARYGPGARGTR